MFRVRPGRVSVVGDEILPALVQRLHHLVESTFDLEFRLLSASKFDGKNRVHVLISQQLGRDMELRLFPRDGRAGSNETFGIFILIHLGGSDGSNGSWSGRRKIDDGGDGPFGRLGGILGRRAVERVEFDQGVSEWQIITDETRKKRRSASGRAGLEAVDTHDCRLLIISNLA